MRTLWLLRHAKADPGGADQNDHERPLAERGRRNAERMGRHLAARGVHPEWTLCSSARRTRETLDALALGLGAALAVDHDSDLYLASADAIAARIRAVAGNPASLLVVGHNPGIAELALRLARDGDGEDLAAMRTRFPTCALAEIRLAAGPWRDLSGGTLASYATPKRMGEAGGS